MKIIVPSNEWPYVATTGKDFRRLYEHEPAISCAIEKDGLNTSLVLNDLYVIKPTSNYKWYTAWIVTSLSDTNILAKGADDGVQVRHWSPENRKDVTRDIVYKSEGDIDYYCDLDDWPWEFLLEKLRESTLIDDFLAEKESYTGKYMQ